MLALASLALLLPGQDPISLEDLLRRAQAAQSEAQAPLGARIDVLFEELNREDLKNSQWKSILAELRQMGAAAGPLLVPGLDPGVGETPPNLQRAERLSKALLEFEDLGTALALLDAGLADSDAHALRAMDLLVHTKHRQVVGEALLDRLDWSAASGGPRRPLAIISQLDGPEAALALRAALETQSRQHTVIALESLTAFGNRHVGPDVLKALEQLPHYTVLQQAVRYYSKVPSWIDSNDTIRIPLMRIAEDISRPVPDSLPDWEKGYYDDRISVPAPRLVIGLLNYPLEMRSSGDFRSLLWDWHKNSTARRRSILQLLARIGDGKAKREFMAGTNESVAASKREGDDVFATALSLRARDYMLIGDSGAALRDAQRGLKHAKKKSPSRDARVRLYIAAATASALRDRHRDAADYLDGAGLDREEILKLRAHPAFAEFLQSKFADSLTP